MKWVVLLMIAFIGLPLIGMALSEYQNSQCRLEAIKASMPADDILKDSSGAITRNKYIELKKIIINDVGYEQSELLRLGGCWYKDSDAVTPIKNCLIHEAGTFVFRFKSPFAYWALQNLKTEF